MNDKISVIVPVYNAENYLNECVDSIINQSYTNLEIILVDDGSPDRSPAICDEYALKDNRINVIHKANGGQSEARNVGIRVATGKWITFVDSDDYLPLNAIETLYNGVIDDNTDFVSGDYLRVSGSAVTDSYFKNRGWNRNLNISAEKAMDLILRFRMNCSACGRLFRREVLRDTIFPANGFNEELIFLCKYCLDAKQASVVEDPVYYYRENPSSLTRNFSKKQFDVFINISDTRRLLRERNQAELLKSLNVYENILHLNIYICLRSGRSKKEFPIENEKIRAYVRRNIITVLIGRDYTIKDKVKALLCLTNL